MILNFIYLIFAHENITKRYPRVFMVQPAVYYIIRSIGVAKKGELIIIIMIFPVALTSLQDFMN